MCYNKIVNKKTDKSIVKIYKFIMFSKNRLKEGFIWMKNIVH